MGLLPKKLLRFNRRKKKISKPQEFSEEELDEERMHELEETLADNSDFIVLKGERLERHRKRMAKLEKVFFRKAWIPMERPTPLANNVPSILPGFMGTPIRDGVSGGIRAGVDDGVSWRQEEHQNSYRSSMASSSQGSRRISDGLMDREPPIAEAVPIPIIRTSQSPASPYPMKEQMKEGLQGLESDGSSGPEIPAAILSSSVHGDSAMPDTATSVDTLIPFSDTNDWNQHRPLMSFSDYQTPLPMKVTPFIDRQTQKVASTHSEEADRSLCPRTPAKDRSSTDGLLFSADSFEMSMQHNHHPEPQPHQPTRHPQTPVPSSTRSSSPVLPGYDSEGGNDLLQKLRDNTKRTDRMFRVSRMSLAPNFPVNVWDDVAPTRLHAQLINIAMDQDHNLLPVMY